MLFTTVALMASTSSNNYVPLDENDDDDDDSEEEEAEEASHKLELELRLGASSEQESRSSDLLRRQHFPASSSAAFSTSLSSTSLLQLQGGLGLGFHHPPSSWPWHVGSGPSGTRVQRGNLHLQPPRTVDCNRRPETNGVWFSLRSAPNREGEMLPQLPRAYIRVKDENVTILTVKTYLVTKLGLTSVAEVDISCMGQPLLHSQTLKYVRDAIWRPRLAESLSAIASRNPANETTLTHLMPLHYGRHCLR